MPKKKNRKVFNVHDEDRISNLPDDLIANILSRFPTKDVVATSILSKDWKYKWLCIYQIDIDFLECNRPEVLLSFVNCLETLFQRGINVRTIYFRAYKQLFVGNFSLLESLISGLVKYKSEILDINLLDINRATVIPGSLLNRETLRQLLLEDSFFEVPSENCFPHLKTLCMRELVISRGEVETSNEIDNAAPLKFIFPVLETLEIVSCEWENVKLVEIHAPSLRRLQSTKEYCGGDNEIKIFGATGPVRYVCNGECLENIQFIGSNLVAASILCNHVDICETPFERGIMECLSNVVELVLSYEISKIFAKTLSESKHGSTHPIFNKLERLSICCDSNTEPLIEILHAAPFLKFLDIDAYRIGKDDDDHEFYDSDAVESIPSCVMSTLEEMKLVIYIGSDGKHNGFMAEFGFLKILLQIGAKGELSSFCCKIKVSNKKYGDDVMELISSLPRAPPHFILSTKNRWNKQTKRFSYRESSGWVEHALV